MRVGKITPIEGEDQGRRLDECLAHYDAWRFLAPTCTTEVVIGAEGARVHPDRPVPGDILKRLTYLPRRGPRPIKHVSDDGRLLHSFSVQGIYRLTAASAADLDVVLTGPPGTPITWSGSVKLTV